MYVYIAIALAALLAGFTGGWQTQEWRYGAKEADRLAEVARDRMRAEKNIDMAAAGHEKDKAQIRTVTKVVIQEVERIVREPFYVASDAPACLDDDGLRQLAAAIGAAPAASQPAGAVRKPDAPR